MCILSSVCMYVYQCDYLVYYFDSIFFLENKLFVGIVIQWVLCFIRRKIKYVINLNIVILYVNIRLEVNSICENYKLLFVYCIYKE